MARILLKAYSLILICTLFASAIGWANNAPVLLPELDGDSGNDVKSLPISPIQARWLQAHPVIKAAVVENNYIPFNTTGNKGAFAGITADYSRVIGEMLKIKIDLKIYATRQQAEAALRSGEVDLYAGNIGGISTAGLLGSEPYDTNRQAIVQRLDASKNAAIQSIAVVQGYIRSPELQTMFANARVTVYGNQYQALEAVAYGRADAFIGNATSANYLIGQLQFFNLRIRNFLPLSEAPFAYLAASQQEPLITLINLALNHIPIRFHAEIQQRWSGTRRYYDFDQQVQLTLAEAEWIRRHPTVRYAALRDWPPFLFSSSRQRPIGLSVDLLEMIGRKTGLRFEPVWVDSTQTAMEMIRKDQLDVLPIKPIVASNLRDVLFSSAYAQAVWGILVKQDNMHITRLDQLGGKRVGIIAGSIALETIKDPALRTQMKLVAAADTLTLLDWLGDGKVDAVLLNVATLNYLNPQVYQKKLKIAAITNEIPTRIGMAISPVKPELQSIINKSLASMLPEDLTNLQRDWLLNKVHELQVKGLSAEQLELLLGTTAGLLGLLGFYALYQGYKIRQKRQAEIRLKERLALQGSLINGLPFAVFIRDDANRIVSCNSFYEQAYRQPGRALLGRHADDPDWPAPRQVEKALDALCSSASSSQTLRFSDLDVCLFDDHLSLSLWAAPFYDQHQQLAGIQGGWIDISDRKRTQRELEDSRIHAETANRAKSTFLATISHEIRTPMNAILGLLEMRLHAGHDGQPEELAVIHQTAKSLLELIDDILDYSKIEAGQLSLHPVSANATQEISRQINMYRPLAKEKGLELSLSFGPGIPAYLQLDALRLRQIVGNLVSNAIKFTQQGQISVEVKWSSHGQADGAGSLLLQISDTGIGIHEQDQSKLFQAFKQGTPSTSKHFGGTGLGLWICQQLVNYMKGSIKLTSRYGEGSCFLIELPFDSTPTCAPAAAEANVMRPAQFALAQRGLTALVVDDHPANRLLLSRQLSFLGIRTKTAENGAQALEIYAKEVFDLVITDCAMPEMDGYALAQELRRRDLAKRRRCLIIGYTADARQEVSGLTSAAGMDDCLTKPVALEQLQRVLTKHEEAGLLRSDTQPEIEEDADLCHRIRSAIDTFSYGDREASRTVLKILHATNLSDAKELAAAMRAEDAIRAAELVHKIKGGAQLIDAAPLIAACIGLEQALASDPLQSRRHYKEFCASLHTVNRTLENPVLASLDI